MGILDIFNRSSQPTPATNAAPAEGGIAGAATGFVERLLDVGIDGKGTFDSAESVAAAALREHPNPDDAVKAIVNDHLKLVAAGGFVTGLGGFITLPVALPANVASFYILATRMAGAIAHVRGYSLTEDGVRSAVLLSLVGADSRDLLSKAGYTASGRLANLAAQRLPGPVMMAVNKAVGFRLLTQMGRSTLGRLGRGVPFVGGAIGAGLDSYMLKQIADHVREEFPPKNTWSDVTS